MWVPTYFAQQRRAGHAYAAAGRAPVAPIRRTGRRREAPWPPEPGRLDCA